MKKNVEDVRKKFNCQKRKSKSKFGEILSIPAHTGEDVWNSGLRSIPAEWWSKRRYIDNFRCSSCVWNFPDAINIYRTTGAADGPSHRSMLHQSPSHIFFLLSRRIHITYPNSATKKIVNHSRFPCGYDWTEVNERTDERIPMNREPLENWIDENDEKIGWKVLADANRVMMIFNTNCMRVHQRENYGQAENGLRDWERCEAVYSGQERLWGCGKTKKIPKKLKKSIEME